MDIAPEEFWGLFFEEADECLESFEASALRLERHATDEDAIHCMFRAAHSLKGCSATLGIDDIASFTHALETLLVRLRDGDTSPTRETIDLLLSASDGLRQLLGSARRREVAPPTIAALIVELESACAADASDDLYDLLPGRDASEASLGADYDALCIRPHETLLTHGLDPLPLLRELLERVPDLVVTLEARDLCDLASLDPERCLLRWVVSSESLSFTKLVAAAVEVFRYVDDLCDLIPRRLAGSGPTRASVQSDVAALDVAVPDAVLGAAPKRSPTPREAATLKVAASRVDEIIDLVGELVIAQGALRAALPVPASEKQAEAMARMGRSLRDLQRCALAVRTLPLTTVFARFPRLVRDLGRELGRSVDLQIEGGETELDKSVIEGLAAPLTHIVRNAVDHGVEPAKERARVGKSEQGRLTLSARQSHGSVVLQVEDDGAGLDRDRILARAVSLGLAASGDVLSDEQVHEFIFEPGFSTAAQVTDISGRGVGMDAAREAIHALNGTIRMESVFGEGTRTTITLPLSLAILDGFGVQANGQPYIIPMASVISVTRPGPDQLGRALGAGEYLSLHDRQVAVIRLGRVLAPDQPHTPSESLAVVIEVSGEQVALMVDDVDGQASVVIKALDESLRTNPALLGGTVDGDGGVTLILDLAGIIRVHRGGYTGACLPVAGRVVAQGVSA